MLDKIVAALLKLKSENAEIRTAMSAVKDGEPGKDGATVAEVLALVPKAKDGRDGRDGATAAEVLALTPKPRDGRDGKNGRDGTSPDIKEIAALVPKPKNGRDGTSPDIKEIAALVPKPKNGRDGKDGKPGKNGVSITDVKLQNNELFVFLDGRKRKAGAIKLPAVTAPFRPGSDGGGGSSGRVTTRKAVVEVSGDIALNKEDVILVDTTLSSVTVTLPATAPDGLMYVIKRISDGNNDLILDATPRTIDGDTTKNILFKNTALNIVSKNDDWFII